MITEAEIAERVREGRLQLGLTQAELAKAAATSRPTIARIEGGSSGSVSLDTMLRVLNAVSWDFSLERGVAPLPDNEVDIEAYLDSLFGDAR